MYCPVPNLGANCLDAFERCSKCSSMPGNCRGAGLFKGLIYCTNAPQLLSEEDRNSAKYPYNDERVSNRPSFPRFRKEICLAFFDNKQRSIVSGTPELILEAQEFARADRLTAVVSDFISYSKQSTDFRWPIRTNQVTEHRSREHGSTNGKLDRWGEDFSTTPREMIDCFQDLLLPLSPPTRSLIDAIPTHWNKQSVVHKCGRGFSKVAVYVKHYMYMALNSWVRVTFCVNFCQC